MFNRKKYYVSSLSLKNIYLVKKELQNQSAYEKRMQTIDEYNTEYVILFEKIGTYNPLTTPAEINIDKEAAKEWLRKGAIPTDTVKNLFSKAGIMKEFHEEKQGK